MTTMVVAIDGPAGSGKSSVSRAVAKRLGFAHLDTGAFYRVVALHALRAGVDFSARSTTDHAADGAVLAALAGIDYRISTDPDHTTVVLAGADVTEEIRGHDVTEVVSAVARISEVRQYLVATFRALAAASEAPGIVIEGRDITTVVAPDAPVRILLTASEEARMARRSAEAAEHPPETVGEKLRQRDRADSRVVDFMNAAEGVTVLDSTDLNFDQTVDAVADLVAS